MIRQRQRQDKLRGGFREVVVLFSGGRDSSLATCLLISKGKKVHLLTFNDGVTINLEISEFRHQELKSAFSESIVSRNVVPSYGLFRKIALVNLESDFIKFKKNLIFVGTQLAFHTEGIIYCLRHNIRAIASGFTQYESHLPEQMPEAIKMLRSFIAKYKIDYLTPVYDYSSEEAVKEKLFEFGISTKSLEGFSIFADTSSYTESEVVLKYLMEKLPICEKYIRLKLNM